MSVKQDDIQSMLRKLFLKYACDGSKLNMNYLRLGKFLQMMQDAHCIDGNLNIKQLELIFCSENKHRVNMTFETFLETIPRIVREKYPKLFSQKPGDAFNKLLKDHFFPLFEALMQPGSNQDFEIDEVDNDCVLILHDAHNGLKELYSLLFPWEIRRTVEIDVLVNRSQRALHAFLRDFDICPTLINKNHVNRLWNSLILVQPKNCQIALELLPDDRLELGTCLTFSKFLLMLYHISLKGYEEDLNLGPSPPPEKLLVLLERMELSKGFQALSSRVAKFGLLPSQAVIHRVLYPETENIDEFSQASGNESELVDEVVDLDQSLGLQLSPMGLTKLEENIEKIQHIFQSYCSYGEPLNTTKLSSSKLIKMMRDCGVLYGNFSASSSRSSRVREGPISTVDIDLIFTRLSNKPNSNGRLDFRQFLKALHEIATKAFLDGQSEDCLMHLLDEYILKLDQGSDNIRGVSSKYVKGLMDMLKDDEVIEALSLVHRSIIYYYRYYANSRGNMSFDNFIRFCRDFGIFPDLIPKAKLLRFFYTLSSIHAQTEQPEISVCSAFNDEATLNKSPDEVIDEHLFVEALALIAAEVLYKEPEPNSVERICYLMERLGQSDGPQKVMIACGHNRAAAKESQDLTAFLRQRYPEVFQEYNPARVNFGDLMTQIAEDM